MNIKLLIIFILFMLSFPLFSDEKYSFKEPKSSPDKLLITVEKYIIDERISLEDYYLEIMSYDYIQQRWHFYYSRKVRSIGADFTIRVNDNNPNEIQFLN